MTAPAAASDAATSSATAGVGSTPRSPASTPAAASPAASAPLEHRAATAGVATDQHPRPRGEAAAEGPPDREGELGRQVAVRHPADPVGPEQPP